MKKVFLCLLVAFICLVGVPQVQSANNGDAKYEIVFWESVKDSEDPRLYQSYLDRYPNGVFADIARLSIAKFGGSTGSTERRPPPLEEEDPYARPGVDREADPERPAKIDKSSCQLAVFPWKLLDDASYMKVILKDNIKETIDRYKNLEMPYSYYEYPKSYGIGSLSSGGAPKMKSTLLWRNSKPNLGRIIEFGEHMGVDGVMIGTLRVTNPWSDRYKLGYIRIYIVDIQMRTLIKEVLPSSSRDATEELPILLEKIVSKYSSQFCSR